jgi:hypothetical protein
VYLQIGFPQVAVAVNSVIGKIWIPELKLISNLPDA